MFLEYYQSLNVDDISQFLGIWVNYLSVMSALMLFIIKEMKHKYESMSL